MAQILNRVAGSGGSPGSITFTYLSGGTNSAVANEGDVHTLWADYGRKVYFEPLLGAQTLGQTFAGMFSTPYDGDMHNWAAPNGQAGLGDSADDVDQLNPWYVDPIGHSNYSLQGKTTVFLRLQYNDVYFKGGLPQISFLVTGKNNTAGPSGARLE